MTETSGARDRARGFSIRDLVAGASVALMLIPQSVAYAELAGLPAQVGLYTAALPPIVAALFASSPYLQTGPGAPTALLTLGALLPLAARGTPEYIALAALLALVVGVIRLLVGLLKAGVIAFLLSQPVLMAFTTGTAAVILATQIPGALGVTVAPAGGVLAQAAWALGHPGAWETSSLVLAAATVALILGARRIHPLVPGILLAAAGGIAWSALTGYGGPVVGEVPRGFPHLAVEFPWRALPALLVPGLVIALVGFADATSVARTFAAQDRSPWDPDREFLGQGLANLAAAFSGGFPVGGSFARSTVARFAGAHSRWTGAVAGVLGLAFLPFAGVLAPLPRAVLAAIVMAAVSSLVKVRPLLRLWHQSRPQALVAYTTVALALVLAPRIDQAVLVGVVLSLSVHAWREMKPRVETWTEDRTLHVRPEGVLWFGSAHVVEQALLDILGKDGRPDRVALHLGALGRLDLSGALGLQQLMDDAKSAGVTVELVDVPAHAERILGSVLGWRPG
ncbi:MAG: SulP family inorganic anion transporter [Gemmatimonadetes bacterium]|nr:SulP family inorganic anion transporter [Gemmatimonadota bacterium]